MEHIDKIISNIPSILQYFVPGIIFIVIVRVFSLKKFAEKYTIIMSCVISYIFVSLIQGVNRLTIKNNIIEETLVVSAIAVVFALVSATVFSLIVNSITFRNITLKWFHKTLFEDIWEDVLDFKNGTNLKLYIKDEPYYIIGHYRFNEDKGNDSWMAISAYGKYSKELDEPIGKTFHEDNDVLVTVRIKDIEHMEVFGTSCEVSANAREKNRQKRKIGMKTELITLCDELEKKYKAQPEANKIACVKEKLSEYDDENEILRLKAQIRRYDANRKDFLEYIIKIVSVLAFALTIIYNLSSPENRGVYGIYAFFSMLLIVFFCIIDLIFSNSSNKRNEWIRYIDVVLDEKDI